MHYYSFHIGDYIKQAAHLTPMEDICYRRLLDMYYETERPIPTETDRVSRRLRLDTELVDSVLREFFTLTEKGWENARCEGEISAYHVKVDTARSNGKRGGRPKKTQSVLDRNPRETGSKTNQEPKTNNLEPEKKHTPGKPAKFDPAAYLTQAGVNQTVIADWLEMRRRKRADVTETALTGIAREAALARMTLEDALRTSCAQGWQGFKAEWVEKNQRGAPSSRQAARDAYWASRQAARDAYFADDNKGDNHAGSERDITGEASVIA